MRFLISLFPYQRLLLFDFLTLVVLVGVKCYLTVDWICSSWMTKDAKPLFTRY